MRRGGKRDADASDRQKRNDPHWPCPPKAKPGDRPSCIGDRLSQFGKCNASCLTKGVRAATGSGPLPVKRPSAHLPSLLAQAVSNDLAHDAWQRDPVEIAAVDPAATFRLGPEGQRCVG